MRTETYYKDVERKEKVEVEYDENAPCLICGEPVISASMGGTSICPSCDLGKCRYCKMTVFILKESIDNGHSKKSFLDHIKWHKKETPELVEEINSGMRKFNEIFDKEVLKTKVKE